MKFTAIIIIKSEPKIISDIRKNINEKSKAYLSKEMQKNICTLFNLKISDKTAISKKLAEINQNETGVDERGVYELSFVFKDNLVNKSQELINKPFNKLKLCDYYNIFDLQITDDLLKIIDGYDRFPEIIISPDFKVIKAPKTFMSITKSGTSDQELNAWKKDCKAEIQKYAADSFALILDCHI